MSFQNKAPKTIIEPLDASRHDRAAFTCGVEQVDNFFQKTANKLQKSDHFRVFVMTQNGGPVIGFYAINSHAVDYTELPKRFARDRSGHGSIPAAYISMIVRDSKFADAGYGRDLSIDCLTRIARMSDDIGTAIVMLDVLDCGDAERTERRVKLYKEYGFQPLPTNPMRMFIPFATIKKMLD
ncbi:GNAT family N-acetyltransferase [Ferirhizobium litorale]|uniref:GNAT family N-acetyltransferase n=1 Tax=Ferirhizobium litorale TaxID=2927786 RepID=UPI0028935643|nr:GNAT family N-acetyltransferase [Fererhizobium litorale]